MKERNRLFAILLSVVMAISYMPALAFAEAEGDVPVDTATVEESLDVQPEAEAVEEQPAEEPEAVAPETAEPEAAEAEEVEEELVSTPEDPAAALEPAPEETLETPAQDFGKTDAEIVSIRFVPYNEGPVTLTEGINGYYEGSFFHYLLSYGTAFDPRDVIIVDYSDGTSVTYKSVGYGRFHNPDDYTDYLGLNAEFFIENDGGQSAENPWKVGDTHAITYTYKDNEAISFTINVKIAANPVESIQFATSEGKGSKENPIELVEGVDGYEASLYGPDGPTPRFLYQYYFKSGDVLTINSSDGKSEPYFYNNYQFLNENGVALDPSQNSPYLSLAHGSEPWTVGNVYEGTLTYSGRTTTVYFRIIENPISSIEYKTADGCGTEDNPIKLIEGLDKEDVSSYYYGTKEGDALTVIYKDGTSETYYYSNAQRDFIAENGKTLGTDIYFDLSAVDEGGVIGEIYSSNFKYRGVTGVAYFTLIENPVESVEYKSADGSGAEGTPIKLVEGVDGTYQTDDAGNEFFRYKTRHKAGNTITINYRDPDRESVVYTYQGDGFYDKDHNRLNRNDYYFEQDYDQYEEHWEVGKVYSDIFYCLGVETTVYFTPVENPVKKVEFSRKDGVQLREGRDAVNSDGGNDTFFLAYPLEYKEGDILKVTRQNEGGTSPSEVTYIAVSNPDTDIWYEELKFVKAVNGNTSELDYNDVIHTYDLDWDSDEQTPEKEWKAGETNHWFTVTYNGVTSDQIPVTMLENPVKSFSFSRDGGVVLYEGVDGVNSDGADGQFFKYYLEFKPGDKLNVNTSDDYARVYEATRDDSNGDISFVSKTDPEDIISEYDIAVKSDSDQDDVHWKPNDGVSHKFILSFSGKTCEVPVTLKANSVKSISFHREGYDEEHPITLYEGGDYSYKDEDNNIRYVCPLDDGDKLVINEGLTDEVTYEFRRTQTDEGADERFVNLKDENDQLVIPWDVGWTSEQDGGEEITWKVGDTGVFTLTYMGASCDIKVVIAEGGSTDTKPVKMTWAFKGEDLPRGVIGEDYIYGNDFYHEDNELTITFDDGSTQTYICKDVPMQDGGVYVGYFLNGNTSGKELDGLHVTVANESGLFVEGQNYFRIAAYVNETEVSTSLIPAIGYNDSEDPPVHTHTLEPVAAKAATCENPGNSAYWHCEGCGKYFSDAEGKTEIEENSWVIKALGHDFGAWTKLNDEQHQRVCSHDSNHKETAAHTWNAGEVTKEPTYTEEGIKKYTCTVCGATKEEAIPPLDNEEEKEKADAAIHDSEEAIASATSEDGNASGQASNAEATAATDQPDDAVIDGAVSAGNAAVQAAQEAYAAAQKALTAAKAAYGEGSTQALAAETMVASAKALLASTTKSKATAVNAAATSAGKKADAANAAAAAQASDGTDAAVAAAQDAVTVANNAKATADNAVTAAEAAVAAAEATDDAAAKEAAGKALNAAKNNQSKAANAVVAANSTLGIAQAARDAAIAADELKRAQEAANAELDKVNVNDYSGTEKANVEAALAKGRADIASAQTVDAVNAAKTAALNTIKAQKTDAQKNAEAVVPAAPAAPPAPTEIIDLPTVKISKPAAAKKKITVKWKKVSKANLKKISGIQIQVATDPDFTNIVKTATAGKKKTSKVIKGLQSKTKYYVRIRAYAAGDHYSVWKSKSAKVK